MRHVSPQEIELVEQKLRAFKADQRNPYPHAELRDLNPRKNTQDAMDRIWKRFSERMGSI